MANTQYSNAKKIEEELKALARMNKLQEDLHFVEKLKIEAEVLRAMSEAGRRIAE